MKLKTKSKLNFSSISIKKQLNFMKWRLPCETTSSASSISQRLRLSNRVKVKILLIAIFISPSFWLGMSIFEESLKDFFSWQYQRKQVIIIQTDRLNKSTIDSIFKPLRNWQIPDFETKTLSVISAEINSQNYPKVLFQKNKDVKLPIASLVKLMTALIVLEYYSPQLIIEISKEAANEIGETGKLRVGEKFYAHHLLYPLLIESSNGAAYALSEVIGKESFVELMNLKAQELEMENTLFVNPSGLDNIPTISDVSYSTVNDLILLTQELINRPKLMNIISRPEYNLRSFEGVLQYQLINTNELLTVIPEMIGGKTGFTKKAGESLLVILESPKDNSYIVNIVLGSWNRFEEMKKLIEWTNKAFVWD